MIMFLFCNEIFGRILFPSVMKGRPSAVGEC
jgi:hypothetical protein